MLPSGKFMMGSAPGEVAHNHRPGDEGWGRGRRPVINVSWPDAKEYVRWLSAKTGMTYRLLSEAEWEYAARAGTTTRYAFGDTIDRSQAHFGVGRRWGSVGYTMEVGSFRPNKFGLYDMHGNVFELVEDNWHRNYEGSPPTDGSVWKVAKLPPGLCAVAHGRVPSATSARPIATRRLRAWIADSAASVSELPERYSRHLERLRSRPSVRFAAKSGHHAVPRSMSASVPEAEIEIRDAVLPLSSSAATTLTADMPNWQDLIRPLSCRKLAEPSLDRRRHGRQRDRARGQVREHGRADGEGGGEQDFRRRR